MNPSQPTSIGAALAVRKGVGPGFDLLRVTLALSVVAWHSWTVTGASDLDHAPLAWFPGYAILAMFFALSGFLITASALRLTLGEFLLNRGLRIVPALFVEIMLSAFILGAVFTTLPLRDYYTSFGFWHYFTNVVGLVNYTLPGVFEHNADPAVNNSLWTIPFEIGCYLIMSAFVVFGALRWRGAVLLAFAAFVALGLIFNAVDHAPGTIWSVIDHIFISRGSRLFAAFLLGVAAYLYRDEIPYRTSLAVGCVMLCLLVMLLGPADWLSLPLLNLLVAPALVYLTVFIGVSDVPTLPVFRRGDYSYGIYLYGFPLQQTTVSLFPWLINPLLAFLLAIPFITMFAMFSWHGIEKPILKLRRNFSFIAKSRLEEPAQPRKAEVVAPAAILTPVPAELPSAAGTDRS